MRVRLSCLILLWACLVSPARQVLPNTQPLTLTGDLSAQMVAGIDRFLTSETERSIGERQRRWQRDFSSVEAYNKSVQQNREKLRRMVGAADARLLVTALEIVGTTASPAKIAETDSFTVEVVRWPVFEEVYAEGLWLQTKGEPVASIVVIPDADPTPVATRLGLRQHPLREGAIDSPQRQPARLANRAQPFANRRLVRQFGDAEKRFERFILVVPLRIGQRDAAAGETVQELRHID
jgi:hypothetical protein